MKLVEVGDAQLSRGVWQAVERLRNIANSFEREHMASSAGAMREAVALIIELEGKLRRTAAFSVHDGNSKGPTPGLCDAVAMHKKNTVSQREQVKRALGCFIEGLAHTEETADTIMRIFAIAMEARRGATTEIGATAEGGDSAGRQASPNPSHEGQSNGR